MGGPGAALFLGVNMTTVSWGQKALILFRGLECAGEGEYKDRVGAGWCLRRAASLGFREPPPPARGQTGGVGQLREVMHRGLPTGPRPWGAGPDCSFLLVPWTPGSSWGWDGGKRGGGGVTPGGQGFCPLPVPLQRGAFRAIMLALPLASAWSTGLALTPHPGDSSAMSPPGVVANTGTRLAVVLRARRWAEAAPREAGRLGVGQATARCGQQRWRGRAEQEPLARAGGGTQARLGRGPS